MKTKAVSDTALQPLIDFVNAENGRKAQLARLLGEAMGTEVHRQLVEGWVHPDPNKRVEPRMGLGIILLRVGGEMMGHRRPLNLGNTIKKARKLNDASAPERNGHPRRRSRRATTED